AMAPATRIATDPAYRSVSSGSLRRTIAQATTIARKAPAPRAVIATDARHDSLNGETMAGTLPPMPWPVHHPHATVASRTMEATTTVRDQIGVIDGRCRVLRRDWTDRTT